MVRNVARNSTDIPEHYLDITDWIARQQRIGRIIDIER